MPLENAKRRFDELRSNSGGSTFLNAIFPNEFEAYIFAFELVDSRDNTIEYLVFPINPRDFSESKPFITNIVKTGTGYVTINNNSFVARNIRFSGNFGKKFKFLLGKDTIINDVLTLTDSIRKQGVKQLAEFSPRVKTGYGICKLLEKMLNKTSELDEYDSPYTLYFYNASFGNNYIVKPIRYEFTQSMESNMIWNYTLELQGLSPIESFSFGGKLTKDDSLINITKAKSVLQQGASNILSNLGGL